MNNEASNLFIKDILLKQLQLLHEKSAECNSEQAIIEMTGEMISISRLLYSSVYEHTNVMAGIGGGGGG